MSKKKDRSKKENKYKIKNLEEFKQFINRNKAHDRNWYYGLEGKWWWGMTEKEAVMYIEKGMVPEIETDRIVLASTWGIKCGIATYTKYLFDEVSLMAPNSFVINPINDGKLKHKIKWGLTHLQHEYGIISGPPGKIKGKLIITWHTVSKNTNDVLKIFEYNYDVVAYIVHSECARHDIDTSKDILTVPHGSVLIPEMRKEDARKLLGINIDMPIGFVFGFQSGNKNYDRLIEVAKSTGIHIIISGAPHNGTNSISITNDKNVTFINRFLTENEVNFYALASDIFIFDYVAKDHYSVSGALHRIAGAGRPIICTDVRHFSDIKNEEECLKFKNHDKLKECIRRALEYPDSERLSIAARKYAENTSWEKIARRHIEIYKRYIDINSLR